jgi:prepilin-type N-terminal cleavage/methylation domain-containing protein
MDTNRNIQHPTSNIQHRRAFTLVELLVVITIIGILASLIVTAAIGAMGKAQDTRIKAEINQIDAALVEYKNKVTAFPPNCQTDGTDPIDENAVFNDLKVHLKQIAPRHQEPDDLLRCLAGLNPQNSAFRTLDGGLTAGEAIVFWLGGFSSDPKYPISGEGGPSYNVEGISGPDQAKADPVESRKWVFPFEVTRLAPRDADKYFDESDGRFITYPGPKNEARRINFWQYTPRNQEQPYLYFDVSRHPAYDTTNPATAARFDPPAATASSLALHVHPFKKRAESASAGSPLIEFMNAGKFQVFHCGRDDEWDEDAFEQMSVHELGTSWDDYVLFPEGPFIGEMADTIVNFTEQTKIEDAQP